MGKSIQSQYIYIYNGVQNDNYELTTLEADYQKQATCMFEMHLFFRIVVSNMRRKPIETHEPGLPVTCLVTAAAVMCLLFYCFMN